MLKILTATTADATTQLFSLIIPLAIVFIVFYFFAIRPQKKQEKETKQMLDSLVVGDEIITIGGIIGKIIRIKEETLTIETAHEHTRIRILRSAVRKVQVKAEDAEN